MDRPFLLTRVLLEMEGGEDHIEELSAAARTPDGHLWLGSDELQSVERLRERAPHVYGERVSFHLGDFVPLPSDDEIDIEGLAFDDGYLWLTGSHSLKRSKAEEDEEPENVDALAEIVRDDNRFLLLRLPLVDGEPFRRAERGERELRAAALGAGEERSPLLEELRDDAHLGPFIDIPSKDNGLDVEGLAVRGGRVLLGLRGPVLRGWAVLVELHPEERDDDGVLQLRTSDAGRRYYKHFLDLDGLGVRELCWWRDDLLVLAGPTMDHEGAMRVFRWKGGPASSGDSLTRQGDDLELLFHLPMTVGGDHAEGLSLYPAFGNDDALLIVYDDPKPERMNRDDAVFMDAVRLPRD